jgi:hypothetical protein
MLNSKQDILEALHQLLLHNVNNNGAYKNRYNGFYGELCFNNFYRNDESRHTFSGGVFIPTEKGGDPFDSSVYYTVCKQAPNLYKHIYSAVAELADKGLFYFQYSLDKNVLYSQKLLFQSQRGTDHPVNDVTLPFPCFTVFKFNFQKQEFEISSVEDFQKLFKVQKTILQPTFVPKIMEDSFKEKLLEFSINELLDVYFNRLIFDGITGYCIEKGSPLDIDLFTYKEADGKYRIIEVKEKDLSKNDPIGFGLDTRRIESLKRIEQTTLMKAIYVVRQIKDQDVREFENWRYITLDDFSKNVDSNNVVEGAPGMALGEAHTNICLNEHFKFL